MSTFWKVLRSIKINEKVTNYLRLGLKTLNFRTKKAQIVSLSILAVFIVSQIILPFGGSFASGPRFNFLPGDYETLLLANSTKGETSWRDPVTADYNDRVSFNVYYHNGMEDTVAVNTRIKVNLASTPSTHLISNAYVWADNAAQITDTGTINVNGSTPAVLEYIPGTTQWYPNQGSTPKPDPVNLPDGITTGGVNIGNITGCWPFAGFVVFQAKVVKTGQPQLTITKEVRNVSSGEVNFVDENQAKPGETLEYKMIVSNPGNDEATNVNFRDYLPEKVNYVANSLKIDGNPSSADIFGNYANLGDLAANDSKVITFQVKLVSSGFAVGTTTLINTAKTYADGISIKCDTAKTIVVICQPQLTITKLVKNITKPDSDYLKEGTAWPKDVLEYKISFSNPGTSTALDVVVKDTLPQYTSYISGSAYLYGLGETQKLPDTITNGGVNIGNLLSSKNGYILFRVKVDDCPPVGTHTLKNWAKIWASNVSEKKDYAISILTVTPPPPPVLTIDKKVINITRKETVFVDSNTAYAGDILEYRVTFENRGQSQAVNVIFKDELPSRVELISGSVTALIGANSLPLADTISSGVKLPNLASGQSGSLTFKVKVKSTVYAGEKLINTAHIFADCNIHEQDSATTVIKKPIRIIIEKGTLVSTGTPVLSLILISALVTMSILYIAKRKEMDKVSREAIRQSRISN